MHSFAGGALGSRPTFDLTVVGNLLYGTTTHGGTSDAGTVFTFLVPEPSGYALAWMALCPWLGWAIRRRRA
jgi:hypothetical protein